MLVMKVLKKKARKCLWEKKSVDIGILIPDNLPQLIVEVIKVVDIHLNITDTLFQVIVEVVGVGQV